MGNIILDFFEANSFKSKSEHRNKFQVTWKGAITSIQEQQVQVTLWDFESSASVHDKNTTNWGKVHVWFEEVLWPSFDRGKKLR